MAELNDNIRYLKGVGEARAKAMEKLGIHTLRDLLGYFPRAYEDRRAVCAIADAPLEIPVCVKAMVASPPVASYVRKGMELLKLRAVDESGAVDITWFNQAYLRSQLQTGETYIFYGRVSEQGRRRTMTNPVFEREGKQGVVTGRIMPIYRLTAGVPQKLLISAMEQALAACGSQMPDILPPALCRRLNLAQAPYAYETIHFPRDEQARDQARNRLVFEELYVLAAALAMLREKRTEETGRPLKALPMDEFWAALPFEPTAAQRRAVQEAAADMASGVPMNRLLQGDVGSGKTLVAAALMWLAVKNGCQAAFMAPTEILAEQHYATLSALLEPMNIRVVKLTGSMTAAQKRKTNDLLSLGQADVAVGTHALISGGVSFFDLGLVVTDEQHRFGVAQRSALAEKGRRPHTLVMSAT
ncbi:MAG: DEAD/DEAH box helicase, partial [Oscillospiraceae bacterium]|nr:DEAD/DEAH box helicase [Oscillospiraceae bacterium]